MRCPMLKERFKWQVVGYDAATGQPVEVERAQFQDCIGKECAWWDNTNDICAILQLSKSIYYAGTHLAQIEVKGINVRVVR